MTAETKSFQAEVSRLLDLVTHSLYSNKEIFLRELISNSSDALEKLRFEALSNTTLKDNDLKIWVDFDKEARTVTVRDNGVGMSRDEIVENLGTIAKSGTDEFLKSLAQDKTKDSQLIGQFGVGFYSSFIVSDKVIVKTRRADLPESEGVQWVCEGKGEYQIETIDRSEQGTEIILHLKKDEDEFLEGFRLRSIIKKYSDHISFPIIMKKEASPVSEEEKEGEESKAEEPTDEVVNQADALWTLSRSEIKDDDYKTFYKHVGHDFEDPLLWTHNRVEGKLEYTSLLYVPSRAPFGLWNQEQKHGLKLYVQRVFIMDEAEQLLPRYLRFVRGVVDSNDLPLNVSREILQSNHVVESIRSGCTKRVLDCLEKLAGEDTENYQKFWGEFGQVLKEGVGEDFKNKDRISKLLRFASTHHETDEQTVSLEGYISRLKDKQDKIYYIVGDNFNAAKNSPHLEIFKKKGIEVLLLCDRIDEWLVSNLFEFEGKQLQSVAKGDLGSLGEETQEDKQKEEEAKEGFESMLEQVKKVLADQVQDVRLTHRLTDSPACLVSEQDGMSLHLQRLLKEAGQDAPDVKPIFEINPEHPIVLQLKDEADDMRFSEWTHILFDQALLAEGGSLKDPATFVKRLNQFILQVL